MAIIESFDLGQNYISPIDFEAFILSIDRLPCYLTDWQKPMINAEHLKLLFKFAYYCALRISEAINIQHTDYNLERAILTIPKAKTGKMQKTTIPRPLIEALQTFPTDFYQPYLFMNNNFRKPKLISRQTLWKYGKKAGFIAGLEVFEEQEKRSIQGVWTHLFRKSYGKWMRSKGAPIELVAVKLRHKLGGGRTGPITFTYTKPDINAVLAWERRTFQEESSP